MDAVIQEARQHELGQFFTPSGVAGFMASLFENIPNDVRLLDAGAGSGSLTKAYVRHVSSLDSRPRSIMATAFEVDEVVLPQLRATLRECEQISQAAGIKFAFELRHEDFIEFAAGEVGENLFGGLKQRFNAAIANPPYRKIRSISDERLSLKAVGIEATNLYSAFVSLIMKLLEPGSEFVGITPRSFCNGPYFKPFRRDLLRSVTLRRLHVFESRKAAFRKDDVLQENVIFHVVREKPRQTPVVVSSSDDPEARQRIERTHPYDAIVSPADPDQFIHLTLTDDDSQARSLLSCLTTRLDDLEINVSTGRVVDFRAKEHLRATADASTRPLIYPCHFQQGRVVWPKVDSRKPNAIVDCSETRDLFVPSATYVLTKRFSSKEERRRVVACVYDPDLVAAEAVGFENHLNYFHANGRGLDADFARGLSAFLNSTVVDVLFRQFNGHTQVNATDLRSLRYPTREQLIRIGRRDRNLGLSQVEIDQHVKEIVSGQRQ